MNVKIEMNRHEKMIRFLASGGYLGYTPFAPGTVGTIPGLVICFILSLINIWIAILAVVLFIIFSIWIASKAEKTAKEKDPGWIVIDEIAGMTVTLIGLPFNVCFAVAGFMVFRIMDILKPFPIKYIEKRFQGGTGIVLDDIAAGIISNIILRAAYYGYHTVVHSV